VVHGLRKIKRDYRYRRMISFNTIIRKEIIGTKNVPTSNIYCLLGGGTENVGRQFEESTLKIGKLCLKVAALLPEYTMHIVCSNLNIFKVLDGSDFPNNVKLYKNIIPAEECYNNACLVITRSGRNTISELAYLGIPTISFVTGCEYRRMEQQQNIASLNVSNITATELDIPLNDFTALCRTQIKKGLCHNDYPVINDKAIRYILKNI